MRKISKKDLINFILKTEKTNYGELSEKFGVSKRTVARMMSDIEEEVKCYGIALVKKQNKGVYFKGDTDKLSLYLQNIDDMVSEGRETRMFYIFFKLLSSNDYVTLQDLADELYVSYATLTSDMKYVNDMLAKNKVSVTKNRNGLLLEISESVRRELCAKLINHCWGKSSFEYTNQNIGKRVFDFPTNIKNMFDEHVLHDVIELLSYFSFTSNVDFTDYEFQSLAIHLVIAIDRIKKEKYINASIDSYDMSDKTILLIGLIEEKFDIKIPKFEKNYINIHIVSSQKIDVSTIVNSTDIQAVEVLRTLLKSTFDHYDMDDEIVNALLVHLLSAIKRLQFGLNIRNPYVNEIKQNFNRAFEDALLLRQELLQKYGVDMNEDECAYVALHFESFLERTKNTIKKIKVVLVCSSGVGTSRLLEQRIKKRFTNEIEITRVVSLAGLSLNEITEDLIISTINLHIYSDIPVILVNPFLNDIDIQTIDAKLKSLSSSIKNGEEFLKLIEDDLMWIDNVNINKETVIKKISSKLQEKQYATDGIYESAISREELSSTACNQFAIPHAGIDFVENSKICIYVNEKGIYWDEENPCIKVIFFIAINKEVQSVITDIYEYFNNFVNEEKNIVDLIACKNKEEMQLVLRGK